MEHVDQLIEQDKFAECRAILEQEMDKRVDPEVGWRLARCYYMWFGISMDQLAQLAGTNERIKTSYKMREVWDRALESDPNNYTAVSCIGIWCYVVADLPEVKRKLAKTFMTEPPSSCFLEDLMGKANKYLEECLKDHPNHANALTWYGITIDQLARLDGTNERIKKSFEMKEVWERSLQADPNNYLTHSCMGIWCFTVTDLPALKRTFANTFFRTPPNSTYEEALHHLVKSEELSPKSLVGNLLHLAKTYYRLGDKVKAKEYCEYTQQFRDIGYEVAKNKKEAKDLMKKL
ncbi:unnamed protein product [Echinostoma caproni]|uniref:Regulator of microtubule dynamics protein 1 n=1 Tax=Echinostoma caproni TaxID=27848 RepID=A0A183AFT0_9TREM|nr:unnamed protein product [Echinostoma caproni]